MDRKRSHHKPRLLPLLVYPQRRPQTVLLTGLTRDGTFYIENGEIKFRIKNFRFNESPIITLNNLDALGKPEGTVSGESNINAMIPPMKIRDFIYEFIRCGVGIGC